MQFLRSGKQTVSDSILGCRYDSKLYKNVSVTEREDCSVYFSAVFVANYPETCLYYYSVVKIDDTVHRRQHRCDRHIQLLLMGS